MTDSTSARVSGHSLKTEGGAYDYRATSSTKTELILITGPRGYGLCSCGTTSPGRLGSGRDRKQWHREHKARVLAQGQGLAS